MSFVIGADGNAAKEMTAEEIEWCRRWLPAGPWPSLKDRAKSHRTSAAIRAAMKQCWFNVRKVVLKLLEYGEASYVEGWAVLRGGMPIEHG